MITLLAILQFIGAVFLLLAAVATIGVGLLGRQGGSVLPLIIGVLLGAFGGLQAWCGIGLWRLKSYGRTIQLVFSWLGVIGFPLGTLISILILVYLYKPGVKVLFSEKPLSQLTPEESAQLAAVGEGSTAMVVIVVVLLAVVAVAVVGIVAAIAIPGFLRARMSGNEASAIGSLRAVNSGQVAYFAMCNGYAPDFPALGKAGNFLTAEMTVAATVTRSGYRMTMEPGAKAVAVSSATPGCTASVTDYFVRADPVTPGTTGIRHFASDARATIVQGRAAIENPIPPTALVVR